MTKWLVRFGWMALGITGLYTAAALADVVSGGSLDPPGPPAPSMKTLEEVPGTWSRILSDSGPDSCNTPRFTCVLAGDAVRDNETGLVWDRTPFTQLFAWPASSISCGNAIIGGRGGWRLPTDAEIRSLLDPNAIQQPLLPDGHPFNVFGAFGYVWTSSPVPSETDLAYAVDTDTLDRIPAKKSELLKKWCVRGVQADTPEDSKSAQEPPAWYQTLDATGGCFSERFRCVMENDEAVLDRETGLVWTRGLAIPATSAWTSAVAECQYSVIGGRSGWRLPTVEEVSSLWVRTGATIAALPAGHPFTVPNGTMVWTMTPLANDAAQALWRNFNTGGGSYASKASGYDFVCVRGSGGYDGN